MRIHIEYWFYVLLILVYIFSNTILINKVPYYGDTSVQNLPPSILIHKTLIENKELPYWIPNLQAGTPLYNPGDLVLNPFLIIFNFITDPFNSFSLSIIFHLLIFFIGFYLLSKYILKNTDSVIISFFSLIVSASFITSINQFWMLVGFAYIPLVIFVVFKIISSRRYILYSLFLSLILLIQTWGGGVTHFYYQIFFIFIFSFFVLLTKIFNLKERKIDKDMLKRVIFSVIIILFLFIIFSIPRFLFLKEGLSKSNRGALGWTPEEVLNSNVRLNLNNLSDFFITSNTEFGLLNLLSHILVIIGIYFAFKKREESPMLLSSSYVFYILLSSGFLFTFLYNYLPGFTSIRGISRLNSLAIIFGSVLSGYGFKNIIKEKNRIFFKYLFIFVIILFFLFFGYHFKILRTIDIDTIKNFDLKEKLNDTNIYRIHIREIKGIDNHNLNALLINNNIESTYGSLTSSFELDYFYEFMNMALSNPKILGLLNVKYLLSSLPLNETDDINKYYWGLSYYSTFNSTGLAITPHYNDTGYIYKLDKYFIPRASLIPISILVFNDNKPEVTNKNTDNLSYKSSSIVNSIMMSPDFDPKKMVVIETDRLTDFTKEELKLFDLVVINNASKNTFGELEELSKELENLSRYNDSFIEIKIANYYYKNPNSLTVAIPPNSKDKILFLSEKYSSYKGWVAKDDKGKTKRILKANKVFSAIILDGNETNITFNFSPLIYGF